MDATRISIRLAIGGLLFLPLACGDDDDSAPAPTPTPVATSTSTALPTDTPTATELPTPPPSATPLDFAATPEDFECLLDWEPVRGFFLTNKLGMLEEALDLARNPVAGMEFPVGTIVQLVPGEAMVKRGADYDPANKNWEYFELDVDGNGTAIRVRGRDDVVNRFGGQCFGCHEPARDFDFICETGRGCVELGLSPDLIQTIQQSDPRCDASRSVD